MNEIEKVPEAQKKPKSPDVLKSGSEAYMVKTSSELQREEVKKSMEIPQELKHLFGALDAVEEKLLKKVQKEAGSTTIKNQEDAMAYLKANPNKRGEIIESIEPDLVKIQDKWGDRTWVDEFGEKSADFLKDSWDGFEVTDLILPTVLTTGVAAMTGSGKWTLFTFAVGLSVSSEPVRRVIGGGVRGATRAGISMVRGGWKAIDGLVNMGDDLSAQNINRWLGTTMNYASGLGRGTLEELKYVFTGEETRESISPTAREYLGILEEQKEFYPPEYQVVFDQFFDRINAPLKEKQAEPDFKQIAEIMAKTEHINLTKKDWQKIMNSEDATKIPNKVKQKYLMMSANKQLEQILNTQPEKYEKFRKLLEEARKKVGSNKITDLSAYFKGSNLSDFAPSTPSIQERKTIRMGHENLVSMGLKLWIFLSLVNMVAVPLFKRTFIDKKEKKETGEESGVKVSMEKTHDFLKENNGNVKISELAKKMKEDNDNDGKHRIFAPSGPLFEKIKSNSEEVNPEKLRNLLTGVKSAGSGQIRSKLYTALGALGDGLKDEIETEEQYFSVAEKLSRAQKSLTTMEKFNFLTIIITTKEGEKISTSIGSGGRLKAGGNNIKKVFSFLIPGKVKKNGVATEDYAPDKDEMRANEHLIRINPDSPFFEIKKSDGSWAEIKDITTKATKTKEKNSEKNKGKEEENDTSPTNTETESAPETAEN